MEQTFDDDPIWLPPRDAIALCRRLFGLDETTARSRLILLAEQAIVRTWCVHFHFRNFDEWASSSGDSWSDGEIPPPFWERLRRNHLLLDWANGAFGASGYQSETHVHGVKFSGADIALYKRSIDRGPISSVIRAADAKVAARKAREADLTGRPKRLAPPSPAKRGTRKPVTAAEFDAWLAKEPPEAQSLGYREILLNAKRHFKRPVARKLAEGVTKGRKPGRKPVR